MATDGGKVGADDFVAAGLGEQLPGQPRTELGRIQPVELQALLARTYTEPAAIIGGGVIPRGSLVIEAGPPKRGKSLLALQQALARSLGWPWLGFPTTRGRTLVIQAEIPERELQTRVRLMQAGLAEPVPKDVVHFVTDRRLRLDQPGGLRTVRTLIETLQPDFVQIDPLARFLSGDENSSREMGRLIAALDELIQAYAIAIELVHHTAKPTSDDPREGGHRLRGSSALFGAADSVMILDKDGPDGFKLAFELRHGPEPAPLRLRRTEHLWLEPTGPPDDLLQVAAIVERLPLRYRPLLEAVQADLEVKERTAQSLVARAKKAGLLLVEDGLYRSRLGDRNGQVAVPTTASDRKPHVAADSTSPW